MLSSVFFDLCNRNLDENIQCPVTSFQAHWEKMFWNVLTTVYNIVKQPTFCNAFTSFPAKWHLRNEHKNFTFWWHVANLIWVVLFDWLKPIFPSAWPIRSTTQTWEVTRYQFGISVSLFLRHHIMGKSVVALKCPLFSQGTVTTVDSLLTHLYKMDTSVKWTLRVGPCLSLLPLFDSL